MRTVKIILVILIAVIIYGCEEKQKNEVWPPNNSDGALRPVITKIYPDPATSDLGLVSYAGVGIVFIEGENFSTTASENRIHFDGKLGTTLEASSTLLKVRMSNVTGDSIKVQLNVAGALLYAEYNGDDFYSPFRAKNVARGYIAIDQNTNVAGLAVDSHDNVYVLTTQKTILKLSHPDSDAVVYAEDVIASTAGNMRMGPDTVLYFANNGTILYMVDANGDISRRRMKSKVAYLDFDSNKNLFLAGRGGEILAFDILNDSEIVGAEYPDYDITSLRIYDGYAYISAIYDGSDSLSIAEGIWRNEILDDDGNLGPSELILDWRSFVGETGSEISEITFDADGEMYIGQKTGNAIYLLNAGEYFYPQILESPVTRLTWGNGGYFYINTHPEKAENWNIIRVETTKSGAIYYGR